MTFEVKQVGTEWVVVQGDKIISRKASEIDATSFARTLNQIYFPKF